MSEKCQMYVSYWKMDVWLQDLAQMHQLGLDDFHFSQL